MDDFIKRLFALNGLINLELCALWLDGAMMTFLMVFADFETSAVMVVRISKETSNVAAFAHLCEHLRLLCMNIISQSMRKWDMAVCQAWIHKKMSRKYPFLGLVT